IDTNSRLEFHGSYRIRIAPPYCVSPPLVELGFTESCGRIRFWLKVEPPFDDTYTPISGDPGGVKRPPEFDERPCRASSVAMKMWLRLLGSMAIPPIARSCATVWLPGSSDQWAP